MSRLIPIVIAVVVIASLTIVEGRMSERWGDNRLCAYCATLLEDTPTRIGDWVGEDTEVDGEVQVVAGARGLVSRAYRNESTGKVVKVWLIVGHARDTARHTPNICYPSNGWRDAPVERHTLERANGDQVTFYTALYSMPVGVREMKERVYWTWFNPKSGSEGPVLWRAPKNVRMEVRAAPALFKLYFSTNGPDAEAPIDESVCLEFAKEFFPAVEPVLAPANGSIPSGFDPESVAEVEGA